MPDGDLDGKIARLEARLRELDGERDATWQQLGVLREQQRRAGGRESTQARSEWTAEGKIALFAALFRGRADVFASRWESRAKSRSGWAPRCANEWKAGVCHKPRVRCGECPSQAFLAPTDTELLGHLQGRQVMGVYPLLPDDTCWFVAVDLDGPSWRADVSAMRDACRDRGLVAAVERSRSGDGAHVWLFFEVPVAAGSARALGLMLLTDAMARSATLSMSSYDRLFPSQDSVPKGGFGSLIALPLQREAREQQNTVFLDERLEPISDQWSYLASLPRIAPKQLEDEDSDFDPQITFSVHELWSTEPVEGAVEEQGFFLVQYSYHAHHHGVDQRWDFDPTGHPGRPYRWHPPARSAGDRLESAPLTMREALSIFDRWIADQQAHSE